MARNGKRSDKFTEWLLWASVSLVCFLANRQLSQHDENFKALAENQKKIEKRQARTEIALAEVKTEIRGIANQIRERFISRP